MSPDERLAGARARRLREEVEAELLRIAGVLVELRRAAGPLEPGCPQSVCMGVAGYLHSFYTGLEAVMARIARAFDEMPTGERWHQQLLVRCAAPREGVRPPLITAETAESLLELLRFRHFFRNAYGTWLVPERLRIHVDAAPVVMSGFATEVRSFVERLAPAEP